MKDLTPQQQKNLEAWQSFIAKMLPFADAATKDLPLSQLLRLSLFQVSVGMAMVLLTGAINRVAIVELGVPASLIALLVSLPMVLAPIRALLGHRSDNYVSAIGWRRGPFIWFGTMLQFGGFAIMPVSLILLSGDSSAPIWVGYVGASLAFLLVGFGLHMTQTVGLALATDLAPEEARPRVVALLYVMLLVGMAVSAVIFGILLRNFTPIKLIQVIQGAAVVTFVLNSIAMWRQEAGNPTLTTADRDRPSFGEAWTRLTDTPDAKRMLVVIGLGTAAFSMQDVLLEPYGGEILGLSVSQTTMLTALFSAGALIGFALAAQRLTKGAEPHRLAAVGVLVGILAFTAVVFSDVLSSPTIFRVGAFLIGFGGGLFSVCTLTAIMSLASDHQSGIVLGAFGAVQATAAGGAIAIGGALRDIVTQLAGNGALGPALSEPISGYLVVYHLEILLLFVCLAAMGPLARRSLRSGASDSEKFGLAAFPG